MESKWFAETGDEPKEFYSIKQAKTRKQAFEKSIEKWEWILKGYDPEECITTCGLCDVYYAGELQDCQKCPIFKFTGKRYCLSTPYAKWSVSGDAESAKQELKFLKKLQREKNGG